MAYRTNYALIPTDYVWDTAEIYNVDFKDETQFRELLVRLYQNLNIMQLQLNIRDASIYQYPNQQITNQQWFPQTTTDANAVPTNRQGLRVVVNFGALPNAAAKSVAHNIPWNGATTITTIRCAATNITALTGIPIPYVSIAGDSVELDLTSTDVVITTSSNMTAYNVCYVIIEYLVD